MNKFADYQTDHLMLIVGTNPLPCYVAARLLCSDATRLHLLVSDGIKNLGIHKRLIKLLGRNPEDEQQYLTVSPSDPEDILKKVSGKVKSFPGNWGLHYTGGRKSAAVHAYRGMEAALGSRAANAVFSYLDADTLELVLETRNRIDRRSAHQELEITLEEILELHGRPPDPKAIKVKPAQPSFTRALIVHCRDEKNRQGFLSWAQDNLRKPDGERLNETLAREVRVPDQIPLIGGKRLEEVGLEWEMKASSIADWLHGKWLEDYVLAEAISAAPEADVHQVVASIRPQRLIAFDVDVVAMQGYRMFAISVTTEAEKGLAKLKLFEAIIRARQIGGDEARIALVCFSKFPEELEKQVGEFLSFYEAAYEPSEMWLSPVRVFGIHDLPNLSRQLAIWFKEI